MVDFPTRRNNTLDVIMTNRPTLINTCCSLPALSDHDVIFAEVNVRAIRRKPVRRKILLWNRADMEAIRKRVQESSSVITSKFTTSTPVEIIADTLQKDLQIIIEDCVPSKYSSTRSNQPWFNTATKRVLRRKSRAFKKARRTNKERDWRRFQRLKKEAQLTCRRAYYKFTYDVIHSDPASRRNKKLGTLIKSKRLDNLGVAPLKDRGFIHCDPRTKANILNRQFTSVFSTDDGSRLPDLPDVHHPVMEDITVCQNGVIKLLRNLKAFTASGPDDIPTKLLKETAVEISPAVTLLFQASIQQSRVPSQWKKANIVPLFKKGSRSSPANYRPISLTSVLCKLCEHIIHCSVIRHLTDNNILSDAQHGFRKRRSCDTQLIITIDDLAKVLDKKSQADVILLDFEKAFDKVSHRHLLAKIKHLGIHGSTLNWISDFLHARTQTVLVDGQKSSEANITSGIPQGSVLGPLLFLMFINDLPACVSSSTTRLFADDSILYREITSSADSEKLQKDLDALQDWEAKWLMRFNASKCQVFQVTKKRDIFPAAYTIHGQVLEVVKSANTSAFIWTTNSTLTPMLMLSPGKPMVPKPSSLGILATAANKWRKQLTTLMFGQLLNLLLQLGTPTLREIFRRSNKSNAVLLDSLWEITTAPVAWQIWWTSSNGHLSRIVDSTAAWWWCTRSITTWSTSKLKTTSLITKHQDTINSEATNPGTTDHILTLQHTPLHSSRKPSGTGITFLEIRLATHPSMPSSLHWGVFRWSNHISAIFICTLYIMHHVHLLVVFETTHMPTAVWSIFCD